MQSIKESAATSCVERFDQYQFDLCRRAPITMEDFGVRNLDEEAFFTKEDFKKALGKVSRKTKK